MDGTYFKVGLFVVAASLILLVGAGWLGAGAMKKEEYFVESYLDEAVSGLDVGAVVKFRGVPVGILKEISFTSAVYETRQPYVRLVLAIDEKQVHHDRDESMEDLFDRAVAAGCRVRLASGGLTGAAYVEIDVFEEDEGIEWDPPLVVDWEPQYYQMPSVPSTLTRLQQNVTRALKQITDADLPGLVADLRSMVKGVDEDLRRSLGPTLRNLEAVSAELNVTVTEVKQYVTGTLRPGTEDLANSITGMVQDDLSPAIRNLDRKMGAVAVDLDKLVNEVRAAVDRDLNPTLANVRVASEGLPETIELVNSAVRGVDIFANSERARIDESLENIRVVTADLRELVESIKRNPSMILFGEPPSRVERGGK
jgi:ABC-type transporter Mla subunit MlaD